jgi:hypothetical protein
MVPTGNIVWKRDDGSVAVTHVFFGVDPEKWRDELVRRAPIEFAEECARAADEGRDPPTREERMVGWTPVAINAELPEDYSTRDRWVFDGGKIIVKEPNNG